MASKMKMEELRMELHQRGLATTGRKSTLVRRLEAALRKEARNHSDGGAALLSGKKRARENETGDAENADSKANNYGKITAIEELCELGIEQLRQQASLYGIPVSGSKRQLLERTPQKLQNGSHNIEDDNDLLEKHVLKRPQTQVEFTHGKKKVRTQQTQTEEADETPLPIDEVVVWEAAVDRPRNGHIYGRDSFKVQSISSASVTGPCYTTPEFASSDVEVWELLHQLELKIQTQGQEHQRQIAELKELTEKMMEDARLMRKRLMKEMRKRKEFKSKLLKKMAKFMKRLHASSSSLIDSLTHTSSSDDVDDDDDSDSDSK